MALIESPTFKLVKLKAIPLEATYLFALVALSVTNYLG